MAMINVQLYPDATITTMDDSLLEKIEGCVDNNNEYTTWVEYRFEGRVVHRSAHVRLKASPAMLAEAGSIG